jgi:amino acid adenylation domain-containing protein
MKVDRNISIDAAISASQKSKEKKYWLDRFSGELVKSVFPYDYNRLEVDEINVKSLKTALPGELCRSVITAANGSDQKIYIILLTGLTLLLEKYSGNRDIVIGSPVLKQDVNRSFINTILALKNQIQDHMTFKELLLRVRQTVIDATENQNYPIKSLLFQLDMSFSHNDFPLFDTAILLENIHDRKYLEDIHINMIFSFSRTAGNIEVEVEYNSSLYNTSTIERIINHFMQIMSNALADAAAKIPGIDMTSAEEKKQLLIDFNSTGAKFPGDKTLDKLFEEQVEKTPGALATVCEDKQIKYLELNEKSNQIARILKEKGVTSDSIVGLMMERSIEMIIGIFGILKAGGAYLPIDWEYPESKNIFILKDSEMQCLITRESIANNTPGIPRTLSPGNIIALDDEGVYREDVSNLEITRNPAALAYVIYTSGSTGIPKGVMVEHRNVVNLVYGLNERIYKHYNQPLRVCLLAPYVFDASVKQVFGSLLLGHGLYIVSREERVDIVSLLQFYKKHKIEISDGTPLHIRLFFESLKDSELVLDIKHFIIGGEALPLGIVKNFLKIFNDNAPVITNVYGPTECCVDSTSYEITRENIESLTSIPIGKPMPNYRVYIMNRKNKLQPVGIAGELCISGEGVARGYLKRDELTSRKFIANPFVEGERMYRSGDLARWLKDGNLEFLGRIDQQVKIRGFRVELGEIESELEKHSDVKAALVTAREDEAGDKYLCAYIVSERELDGTGLRKFLSKELPNYLIPLYFIRIEKIPVTPNGKIDLKALPEPKVIAGDHYTAPGNDIEKKLSGIWGEILGIEKNRISIDANFFELGGHSLKATLLVSKIAAEFNTQISMVEVLKSPSIKEQGQYIEKMAKNTPAINDHNLVLLKKGINREKHLFLIHESGGGVEAFTEFCHHLDAEFNCWGIQWNILENYVPFNSTFEEIAKKYIEKIKKVQPHGPYYIAGWSMGGVIAFEMIRQLERMSEEISLFALLDPIPPRMDLWRNRFKMNIVNQFTCETELAFLKESLPDIEIKEQLENLTGLNKFWPLVVDFLETNHMAFTTFKEAVKEPVDQGNPNFRQMGPLELITNLNVRRSFRNAYAFYNPPAKVKTAIQYFVAEQTGKSLLLIKDYWSDISINPIKFYEVIGDHVSIFKKPQVKAFAKKFQRIIDELTCISHKRS